MPKNFKDDCGLSKSSYRKKSMTQNSSKKNVQFRKEKHIQQKKRMIVVWFKLRLRK
jgi:hypothetical protein